MKIKALIGIATPTDCYSKGGEYVVDDKVGSELVKAGHAIEIKGEERAKVSVPEKAKSRREGNKGR